MIDLPKDTFDFLLPTLGPDPVKILKEELESFRFEEPEPQNFYDDDGSEYEQIPFSKIHRVSTVPGGFRPAVSVFLEDVTSNVAHDCDHGFLDGHDICKTADRQLGRMAKHQLFVSERQGVSSRVAQISSIIEEESKILLEWMHDEFEGAGIVTSGRVPHHKGIFPKTQLLLSTWHSRDVGEMLAAKVAGHRLPAELVELIGECFYDCETEAFTPSR